MEDRKKFKKLKDITKVRWTVRHTSIVTEGKFDVPGTFSPVEDHHTVAINVGAAIANRVVKLHNSQLEHEHALSKTYGWKR